ncbi:17430_t:CDS:2 [Cetraspora pellucida]|uniref:17430_t:CDS:1 n=1 Tax=Cetraspora pellucida TaxID=1433469 RepID=A0ACA9KDH9_9GLOM|nr:17430_t:CDS:2 [Cetraspora pellucida]
MENYANMVEFDNDMFIDDGEESEKADVDYISDTKNLDVLLHNVELEEDELDYNIDKVINASTSKV